MAGAPLIAPEGGDRQRRAAFSLHPTPVERGSAPPGRKGKKNTFSLFR